MTFADEPGLLRTPRSFAEEIIDGTASDDLGPDIGNLLGFTKGFYLQYFAEEHGIEISRLDGAGQARVRRIERHLSRREDSPGRMLVSHYITISAELDESADTSDELERNELFEEVLNAVLELLARISVWAASKHLDKLAKEADLVHGKFDEALGELLPL